MFGILLLFLKVILVITLLAFCFIVWKHLKAMNRIQFYRDQNITAVKGYERFYLGNIIDYAKREDLVKVGEQIKHPELYLLDLIAEQNGEDRFESHRYPVVCFNEVGEVSLKINDPNIVREIYTTFNHLTDKAGKMHQLTRGMLGDSFLFAKNDAIWK